MAKAPNTTLPGVGLVIAGVIDLLYAGLYAIWTGMGLMGGGLVAVSQLMAAAGVTDAKTDTQTVILGVVSGIAPLVQLCVYLAIGLMSLLVLAGGARLIAGQSRGLVYLAALLAVGGPLIGLFANALSFCNIGTFGMCVFGFIGGSAGTLVPLVLTTPFAIWAGIVASNPNYGLEDDEEVAA